MKKPSAESVCYEAMKDILVAMLKQDGAPSSAETHLAQAVIKLNQIVGATSLYDPELTEQLMYCRSIVLGK